MAFGRALEWIQEEEGRMLTKNNNEGPRTVADEYIQQTRRTHRSLQFCMDKLVNKQ